MLHTHEATGSSPVVSTKNHRNQAVPVIFFHNSQLSKALNFCHFFKTHTLTHTGKGAKSTGQGQTENFLSGPVFLPHLLADDPTDGVRCVLSHLRSGVGVGIQREPRRVVAQRAGQRFHVHPAFQRQRGEGVSEVVEPDVLRADSFQNFIMGSTESVRVIHGSGLGGRKQIRVARVLFVLGNQQVNRLLRESQRSHGVACFRRTDHQFPVNSIYLFRDSKRPVFNAQVRPLEGQQFTAPQAGGQLQIEGCKKPSAPRFRKVHPDFLLRQDLHFFLFQLRQLAALGGVGEDQPLRHRLLQAVVQQRVDAPHHSWTEAGIFQRREVFALNSSALLEVVVKPLDLNGGQLVQRDVPNSGDDVVFNVVRIIRFGVWSDARFGIDLVPRFHPRTDRVSPGFGYIQPLAFTDRGLEFLLDLGLRFTQHVLDDPLSALRVIARRVPALPSAVLSFSDISLAVCSSFWHKINPFRQRTIP